MGESHRIEAVELTSTRELKAYKAKLDRIVAFLEHEHVSLLGRTGIFQYNNSDNSIEMGFLLADRFLSAEEDRSIYQAKVKAVSY